MYVWSSPQIPRQSCSKYFDRNRILSKARRYFGIHHNLFFKSFFQHLELKFFYIHSLKFNSLEILSESKFSSRKFENHESVWEGSENVLIAFSTYSFYKNRGIREKQYYSPGAIKITKISNVSLEIHLLLQIKSNWTSIIN